MSILTLSRSTECEPCIWLKKHDESFSQHSAAIEQKLLTAREDFCRLDNFLIIFDVTCIKVMKHDCSTHPSCQVILYHLIHIGVRQNRPRIDNEYFGGCPRPNRCPSLHSNPGPRHSHLQTVTPTTILYWNVDISRSEFKLCVFNNYCRLEISNFF